jgi:hypothetical protein
MLRERHDSYIWWEALITSLCIHNNFFLFYIPQIVFCKVLYGFTKVTAFIVKFGFMRPLSDKIYVYVQKMQSDEFQASSFSLMCKMHCAVLYGMKCSFMISTLWFPRQIQKMALCELHGKLNKKGWMKMWLMIASASKCQVHLLKFCSLILISYAIHSSCILNTGLGWFSFLIENTLVTLLVCSFHWTHR